MKIIQILKGDYMLEKLSKHSEELAGKDN